MHSSVVTASISARQSARSAPHSAAWAQNSSLRQSATRECVFMIPPASLTSFPMCPTTRALLIPSVTAISMASPMKFEYFTQGMPCVSTPERRRKSIP